MLIYDFNHRRDEEKKPEVGKNGDFLMILNLKVMHPVSTGKESFFNSKIIPSR